MSLYFSDESKAPRACDVCGGSGEYLRHPDDRAYVRCRECNGTGRINEGALPDVETVEFFGRARGRSAGWYYCTLGADHEVAGPFTGPYDSEPIALAAARKAMGVRS